MKIFWISLLKEMCITIHVEYVIDENKQLYMSGSNRMNQEQYIHFGYKWA